MAETARFAILAFVWAFGSGCAGGPEGAGDGGAQDIAAFFPTYADFNAAYAAAICPAIVRCCPSQKVYSSVADCIAIHIAKSRDFAWRWFPGADVDTRLADGSLSYDAREGTDCLGDLQQQLGSCPPSLEPVLGLGHCTQIFTGGRPVGASCADSLDCERDLVCRAPGFCAKPDGTGSPCMAGGCAVGFGCIDGLCRSPLDDGQPCGSDDQCRSRLCNSGLPVPSCDPFPLCPPG